MKDNRTVNEPDTTETAEAEGERAVTDLGKFKDVKALLEAYQALEAEFTRRSQKLKEFEASKEQEATVQCTNAQAPSTEATACKEGGAEGVTLSEMSEQMKNAVIEEYLNGVFSKRGVPFVTGGGPVTAAKRTPQTMREAGALAGRLFNKKEDK